MTAVFELARHSIPEMTGGFIAYCVHVAHHKVFEAIHKRLPGRRSHP
jgi:hypothetical protein